MLDGRLSCSSPYPINATIYHDGKSPENAADHAQQMDTIEEIRKAQRVDCETWKSIGNNQGSEDEFQFEDELIQKTNEEFSRDNKPKANKN
jgi:hypothetical protein